MQLLPSNNNRSVVMTRRWKQSVSHFKAQALAEATLNVYNASDGEIVVTLSESEIKRRLYNRNW